MSSSVSLLTRSSRQITLSALFIALLAICSWFTIPLWPVPITLQTFALFLIAAIFPPRLTGLTVTGYLLLGVSGLPIFSQGQGGIAVLLGPTGGFLLGFLVSSIIVSAIYHHTKPDSFTHSLLYLGSAIAIGYLLLYSIGLFWLSLWLGTPINLLLLTFLFPFLPGDFIKAGLVLIIEPRIRKILTPSNNINHSTSTHNSEHIFMEE